MLPLTAFLFAGGMISGVFDAHPELLLGAKCVRRPGETHVQYYLRELDRIDAIMQRMFAEGRKQVARGEKTVRESDESLKRAAAARAKQKVEADALRALGGGIADHPKFGAIDRRTPEQKAEDAARTAAVDKRVADMDADLVRQVVKDPARYQPILDQFRADQQKARDLAATLK